MMEEITTMFTLFIIFFVVAIVSAWKYNKRETEYSIKTKMLKGYLEFMQSDEYKDFQKKMDNLRQQYHIETPMSFNNTYWTKTSVKADEKTVIESVIVDLKSS